MKIEIRSVISDLGKVIIFFDNDIFLNKMTHYSPFSLGEMKELVVENFELVESFDRGKMTPEKFYQEVVARFRAKIDYHSFFRIYNDIFTLNPPVLNIMRKLKSQYRLVLLSNTDVMRYGFIRKTFPEILFFDAYVLSYEVGYMKPDSRIYKMALMKAEAKAEECLFIDDRQENIEAALDLGLQAIHFGPQTDLETSLQEYGLSF